MSTLQDVLDELEAVLRRRRVSARELLDPCVRTPGFVDCRGVFQAWDDGDDE